LAFGDSSLDCGKEEGREDAAPLLRSERISSSLSFKARRSDMSRSLSVDISSYSICNKEFAFKASFNFSLRSSSCLDGSLALVERVKPQSLRGIRVAEVERLLEELTM